MKIITTGILFFTVISFAFAAGKNSHEFVFMDQNFEEFNLISKKMKVEQQCKDETKYKQKVVWVAAKEECKTIPGKKACYKIFGVKICSKLPPQVICKTIPKHKEYKEVPYVVAVCKQVKTLARKFKANIIFNFKRTRLNPNVKIMATMNKNGKVAVTMEDSSRKPVVLTASKQREVEKNGKITSIFEMYDIRTINRSKLLSPVSEKPTNLRFARNGVHFKTNKIFFPKKTFVKLKIQNTKNGRVLINRVIERDLYFIEQLEDKKSRVIFNLKKLGLNLKKKEYKIKIIVGVDTPNKILNSDLPALKASKVRKIVYQF